jgi:hypothetical protein
MPLDRTPQNTLKPKLASNRTAKTPLTPRLAATPSAVSYTSNGSTPRAPPAVQDNVTPVKAFLGSNVTPRSSSRKSRVGVESFSPAATPTSSRPASSIDYAEREQSGGYNAFVRPRSIAGQSSQTTPTPRLPLASSVHSAGASRAASVVSPLFFHASEARLPPQAPLKKAPTFLYAHGKPDDAPRTVEAPSPSLSESKFFRADAIPEAKNKPPVHTPLPISTSPEPLSFDPPPAPPLRDPSPTKDWAHLSYRKGASQVMRPSLTSRNSALSNLSGPKTPEVPNPSRRSSAASAIGRRSHGKSASVSSIDSVVDPRMRNSYDPSSAAIPSPLNTEQRIVNAGSSSEDAASVLSPSVVRFTALSSPAQTSPTKPAGGQSALEMMNDLAANARRERKVLDLEISNSSLLAINRSLEKESRKQKAELRRFRRMSRAGRFSMDTISPSETYSVAGGTHMADLSDMSEEEEEVELLEEEEEDLDSSEASLDEAQMSVSALVERDEAQRLRDEKRLQLDLSKHRELLLDSQKMNQSLKRCMNWTEQLIKDGQKAIEYKVHISDVKLGGRVLVKEEDEDDESHGEESRGLLSPWSPIQAAVDVDSPFFPDTAQLADFHPQVLDPEHDNINVDDHNPDQEPLDGPFEERIRRLHASIKSLSSP